MQQDRRHSRAGHQSLRNARIMRGDDQGGAVLLCSTQQHLYSALRCGIVQAGSGFVGQDQSGLHQHGPRECYALRLSARQLRRKPLGPLRHA
jgi:hypothetical protein